MPTYICTDGHADVTITASSAQQAAQQYVDGGIWDSSETFHVDVVVRRIPKVLQFPVTWELDSDYAMIAEVPDEDLSAIVAEYEALGGFEVSTSTDADGRQFVRVVPDCECITITVDPPAPECNDHEHDWQSPHELLGGIEDNPGVWANGGGVLIKEVCAHCGRYKITDTWANHGSLQGFTSVCYEDADEDSLDWVQAA